MIYLCIIYSLSLSKFRKFKEEVIALVSLSREITDQLPFLINSKIIPVNGYLTANATCTKL